MDIENQKGYLMNMASPTNHINEWKSSNGEPSGSIRLLYRQSYNDAELFDVLWTKETETHPLTLDQVRDTTGLNTLGYLQETAPHANELTVSSRASLPMIDQNTLQHLISLTKHWVNGETSDIKNDAQKFNRTIKVAGSVAIDFKL